MIKDYEEMTKVKKKGKGKKMFGTIDIDSIIRSNRQKYSYLDTQSRNKPDNSQVPSQFTSYNSVK